MQELVKVTVDENHFQLRKKKVSQSLKGRGNTNAIPDAETDLFVDRKKAVDVGVDVFEAALTKVTEIERGISGPSCSNVIAQHCC